MNKFPSNEITFLQYIFFISQVQIGVGIMTLPSELAELASTDGWIAILLGWIVAIVVSLAIIQVMKRHPQDTIFDLLHRYFGKWLGISGSFLFVLYTGLMFTIAFFTAIHLSQTWVLPETANYYLVVLFSIPIFMLVRNDIQLLGRYAELISYMMIVMLLLLIYTSTQEHGHLLHLLPILKEGWMPVLKATRMTALSFLGFEMAFVLYPFLQKKHLATRGIIVANTISMFVFLLTTIVCYIRFSPDQILTYIWPTLNLFETVEFSFIERIEVVFTAFYLFIISTTGIPYLFVAVFGLGHIFPGQRHSRIALVMVVFFIVLGFLFNPSFQQLTSIQKFSGRISEYVAYLFPLCLWLYVMTINRFRRRRHG